MRLLDCDLRAEVHSGCSEILMLLSKTAGAFISVKGVHSSVSCAYNGCLTIRCLTNELLRKVELHKDLCKHPRPFFESMTKTEPKLMEDCEIEVCILIKVINQNPI